jgi:hypothetical protein
MTRAEVAGHLVLSVRTVDSHVAAVPEKVNARTRTEAVARPRTRHPRLSAMKGTQPMEFTWPRFDEPTAIDERRSWTAVFESYDQRNEDIYYVVALAEDGREVARFMVRADQSRTGDDWTGPDFVEDLRRDLHRVAVTGRTNTGYTGPMVRRPRAT